MSFLKRLFKSKSKTEEPPFEIVERQISLDDTRHKIIIRVNGRELFAEDFFRASLEDKDYSFGRFYINNEGLPNTHFAPTLEQAISWFRGRNAPNDGYGTIVWGETVTYRCKICGQAIEFPLRVTNLEKLTVYTILPKDRQIVGWRIVEVENQLLGKGIPTKILEMFKTHPIVKWESGLKIYIHQSCGEKLMALGKGEQLADYLILGKG
jgi:hypothetical protein